MIKRNILFLILLLTTAFTMAKSHRVLFIGDSITDGAWGNSNKWNASSEERNQNDMNHIYGHGYMMLIASEYEALYPEMEWHFWNRGISGNTLQDLSNRWVKDVLVLQPDVVSILIGTNDVDRALSKKETIDVQEWHDTYGKLLDRVLKQNPEATLVLCTPFVAKAGRRAEEETYEQREQMIAQLCAVIRQLASEYKAVLVPFDKLVKETIEDNPNLPLSYWIWDGIHPTPAMHFKMAEMWKDNVRLVE